jgi:hypothetical protein
MVTSGGTQSSSANPLASDGAKPCSASRMPAATTAPIAPAQQFVLFQPQMFCCMFASLRANMANGS